MKRLISASSVSGDKFSNSIWTISDYPYEWCKVATNTYPRNMGIVSVSINTRNGNSVYQKYGDASLASDMFDKLKEITDRLEENIKDYYPEARRLLKENGFKNANIERLEPVSSSSDVSDDSFYSYIASKLRQGISMGKHPSWRLDSDYIDYIPPNGEWSSEAEDAYYLEEYSKIADMVEQGYDSGDGWRLEYDGDPMGY